MNNKKRILWCGEASYLSTGFATYQLEILSRLYKTGKYEIAELAAYGDRYDPRSIQLPWIFYPVLPDKNNEDEVNRYNSSPSNQFGEWKFEDACLAFKPDFVCSILDPWMMTYQGYSPFREQYNWAIMPTVDAIPQHPNWISLFMDADCVFTYTDWGREVLREQSQGRIKLNGTASPGIDLTTSFIISDKKKLKQSLGINTDSLIVGMVSRNQIRKLYPDLIEAFAEFLKQAPEEVAQKTFLYLHTSWPDLGWNIPKLLTEHEIGHKCILTYFCKNCNRFFPSFFADSHTTCKFCGSNGATFPNSSNGIKREELTKIYNLFDIYVQYATNEGFGMTLAEAAGCGVPVFAVDYSAMSDVVRKLGGTPIKVQRYFMDNSTECKRALPDNQDFIDKLIKFLQLPEVVRNKKGFEGRLAVEKYYDYDKSAKVWEDYIDKTPAKGMWTSPAKIIKPNFNIPENLSPEQFIKWGMINIAGMPHLVNSYLAMKMTRDLIWGHCIPHMGGVYFNDASIMGVQQKTQIFDIDRAINEMANMGENRNIWEGRRIK